MVTNLIKNSLLNRAFTTQRALILLSLSMLSSHRTRQHFTTMNDDIQPFPKKQRIGVHPGPDNSNIEQLEVESRSLYFDFLPKSAR